MPLFLAPLVSSVLKSFTVLFDFFKKYLFVILFVIYVSPFLLFPLYIFAYNLNAGLAVGFGSFMTKTTIIYSTGMLMGDIILIFFLSVSKFFKS